MPYFCPHPFVSFSVTMSLFLSLFHISSPDYFFLTRYVSYLVSLSHPRLSHILSVLTGLQHRTTRLECEGLTARWYANLLGCRVTE
jgi:hypothetical protein